MKKILTFLTVLGFTGMLMVAVSPVTQAQFSDTHHLLNAIKDNQLAAARGRLFNGANPNASRDGDPALIMAQRERYYDMMRLLLDNGAYPNSKTIPGEETAISVAALTGDETAMAILIEAGADVNIPDRQGRTPLMKAASSRKWATSVQPVHNEAGEN